MTRTTDLVRLQTLRNSYLVCCSSSSRLDEKTKLIPVVGSRITRIDEKTKLTLDVKMLANLVGRALQRIQCFVHVLMGDDGKLLVGDDGGGRPGDGKERRLGRQLKRLSGAGRRLPCALLFFFFFENKCALL